MANVTIHFSDAAAYERLMGRWSRAVGKQFLYWLKPAKGLSWLDLGCGTGVLSQLILDNCEPRSLSAVDPSAAQINHAKSLPAGQHVDFRVGDAQDLPFANDNFEIVASALVINFIPDRVKALAEMHRVTRAGGIVAGYVWARDSATDYSPTVPIQRAMRAAKRTSSGL